MMSFFLMIIGLAAVVYGANWLVEGSTSIALRMRIKPIVIGLTIIALGTSLPELLVSVVSAVHGNTGFAIGNVVGSNIFNILVILGISAIITPLSVTKSTIWREIPFSFLAAVLLLVFSLQNSLDLHKLPTFMFNSPNQIGVLGFTNGIVFLSLFAIFLYYTASISKNSDSIVDEFSESGSKLRDFGLVLIGLVCMAFGSNVAVDNAAVVARMFGLSESVIGLTVFATGTSLPELITCIVAARQNKPDIAIGNVVGSNLFNILLILGTTLIISPIPVLGQQIIDILILNIATIIMFTSFFVFRKWHIGKVEGIFMLLVYFSYMTYLFSR